VLVKRVWEVRK